MIELCVVIGIIMILAGTAIFQIGPALQSAARRQRHAPGRRAAPLGTRACDRQSPLGAGYVSSRGRRRHTENEILITQKNSLTLGAGADAAQLAVPIQRPMAFFVFPGAGS